MELAAAPLSSARSAAKTGARSCPRATFPGRRPIDDAVAGHTAGRKRTRRFNALHEAFEKLSKSTMCSLEFGGRHFALVFVARPDLG